MANKFPIDIEGRDQFSAMFDRVNKKAASLTRPLADIGKAGQAAAKAAGFDKLGVGLTKIGGVAAETGKKLGVLTGPMAFLGSAGTIAGVAALADQWARAGLTLQNTADLAGQSASGLMSIRAAGELVGVGGDAAASAMTNLSTTLHEAFYGRAPQALAMLNNLGIGLSLTKTGAVDSRQALYGLADAIARQKDSQTQNFIARMFGIQDLLPAIRPGGAESLRQLEEFGRRSGAVMDEQGTAKADQFGLSLGRLKSAVTGVGNALELDMIPRFQPVSESLTGWIIKNRETVASMTELGAGAAILGGTIASLTGALSGLGLVSGALATGGIGAAAAALVGGLEYLSTKGKASGQARGVVASGRGGYTPKPAMSAPSTAGGHWETIGNRPVWRGATMSESAPSIEAAAPSTDETAPRGMRQNNPLNLRSWGNAPVEGGYARFGTEQEGLEAGAANLLAYNRKYGIDTIHDIDTRWAPASDSNDVAAYDADVAQRTGFASGQHLDMRDPAVLAKLESAMGHHEQGRDVASADEIGRAVAAALANQKTQIEITLKGASPGTQAAARGPSGVYLPTLVQYSMPGQGP